MRTRAVLLVAIAVLAAACGGGGSPSTSYSSKQTPQAVLLAAVQHTDDAGSAKFTMRLEEAGSGDHLVVTGGGSIDFQHRAAVMTLHSSGATVEFRIMRNVMYERAGNTAWKKRMLRTGSESSTYDATQYLESVRSIAPDVHAVGAETVAGVRTTHYSGTIDAKSALHATKLDVWVDDAGRVRKVLAHMSVLDAQFTVTIEFTEYGVPVIVSSPSNAEDGDAADQNRATQADLRNALTAEKTFYTDNQEYSAEVAKLKQIEPSLDWGGKLRVVVGDIEPGDKNVVCLEEASSSGTTFALGDVTSGPKVGTYYGKHGCPSAPTPANVAALGSRW